MFNFLLSFLSLGNIILSSAIIIISFSLSIYLAGYNFRDSVTRTFSALLACLTMIFIGDVFLQRVDTFADATIWLKFKWIGIAFIPAAYLHFSDAVMRSTHSVSPRRRVAAWLAYLVSGAFLLLVTLTDLVVRDGFFFPLAAQFAAGPLFPLFTIFFFTLTGWGLYNLRAARERCLTPTTRRRMTYLAFAFFAPALGVFPYLIIAEFPPDFSPALLLVITLLVKIGVALMVIVMAYTVAYQGATSADRIIKHNLVHYLLRGPLVATMVVGLMLSVPTVERWLGLTRETLLFATVIGSIVVLEFGIHLGKSFIDKFLFWNERSELGRIQEIDKRLFTTTDLQRLLENILASLCDLLRIGTAFVAAPEEGQWRAQVTLGARDRIREFISSKDFAELLTTRENGNSIFVRDGFWLLPLRAKSKDELIGVIGIEARTPQPDLSSREKEWIADLSAQAELALEDRLLQQGVFSLLEPISEEIELLQRARGRAQYVGAAAENKPEDSMQSPLFHHAVKDALDHYWGGPKLTENPLLELGIVRGAMSEHEGDPVRALRSLIANAIESLKPDSQHSLTAPEWLLYNILEMKIYQGKKIREIAYKLAVSESDIYRKQRVAIQEVARLLAVMEDRNRTSENENGEG